MPCYDAQAAEDIRRNTRAISNIRRIIQEEYGGGEAERSYHLESRLAECREELNNLESSSKDLSNDICRFTRMLCSLCQAFFNKDEVMPSDALEWAKEHCEFDESEGRVWENKP